MASLIVRPPSVAISGPHLNVFRQCLPVMPNSSLKFLEGNSILRNQRQGLQKLTSANRVSCLFNCRLFSTQWSLQNMLKDLKIAVSTPKKTRKSSVSNTQSAILAISEKACAVTRESDVLQEGTLLEFQKDSNRTLLAVAQEPDGKKNWIVYDQNGVRCSIKPQQITFIVPGSKKMEPSELSNFLEKAKGLLDPTLLQCAWEELLQENRSIKAEDLAKIIYGKTNPLENYCAHVLLSQDEIYFSTRNTKGYSPVYEPRPTSQVEVLKQRKQKKEMDQHELEDFLSVLKSARNRPLHAKPHKCTWQSDEKTRFRIESLVAFALDDMSDGKRRTAAEILKSLGMPKTSSAAVTLLIDIGYFPVHVNLDIMKFDVPTEHSKSALAAADDIHEYPPPDMDEIIRKDLTDLKVYAIDVEEADELDDALSAAELADGRIKVWIHVADPTRWVDPDSVLNKEAKLRGTSIFLPTATIPMFPAKLAMGKMSLKQGEGCPAISVSVVLNDDGSIAETHIENSTIRPTYMMTYDVASELLNLNIEEERELNLLSKAANMRLNWRKLQGSLDATTIEARVKVHNPDEPEPLINLYIQDQSNPAMRVVSEMMILCGEAIASFGWKNNIPLPYRGHYQPKVAFSSLSYIPDGPLRNFTYSKSTGRITMDFTKPLPHGSLGVPGYVQFTSPIRRYVDLLAHYQVKAVLRGQDPPFSSAQLEGVMPMLNIRVKNAKYLYNSSLRYWLLEYLRRQPREMEYRALILKFFKDKMATVLLIKIGIHGSVEIYSGAKVGDEISVLVEETNPRDDFLSLKEV
eukprot:TRINITY_DN1452_c0_g1_i1.p1 TRINITY_DN1452_c0_g1~~TRINITY_DN1452_c0_g1_i1.p1  ORF type:complete len:802 (+),score=154.55 TRINITY_DN1452_c0_g1_i1:173-2578(+)